MPKSAGLPDYYGRKMPKSAGLLRGYCRYNNNDDDAHIRKKNDVLFITWYVVVVDVQVHVVVKTTCSSTIIQFNYRFHIRW